MTEFHTGDLVKLASGITPEIGTVGATGTAHLGGRAVTIIEVLWPIGSVPETTTINGARKLHTSTELVTLTAWSQASRTRAPVAARPPIKMSSVKRWPSWPKPIPRFAR